MAAETDCRLPEAASRAAAQDGAPGAVIGDADENRVEQPPLAGSRQPLAVQQEDGVHEPGLPHQRR